MTKKDFITTTFWGWVLLGVVAGAALLGLVLVSFSDNNAGDIASEVSDWKTYTNNEYGFEIKYPSELSLAGSITSDIFSMGFQRDNSFPYWIFIGDKGKEEIDDRINPANADEVKRSTIKNGNEDWNVLAIKHFAKNGMGTTEGSLVYYVEKGNSIYGLECAVECDQEIWGDSDALTLFNQVFSTFKFNNSQNVTADWKTYKNNQYGFEFRYPVGALQLLVEPELGTCMDANDHASNNCTIYTSGIVTNGMYGGLQVNVIHHELTSYDIHKFDSYPSIGNTIDVTTPVPFGGRMAYKYDLVTSTNYKIKGFVVPLSTNEYVEIYENSKYPIVGQWDQIIASFKFTK